MNSDLETHLESFLQGAECLINHAELADKLKKNQPLTIKAGFDPTAPDLHLGHMVLLLKLRHLQALGHQIVFLVGDFTAMIGDPSGTNKTRPSLSKEAVLQNTKTYTEQVYKLLDPQQTKVLFNAEWLAALTSTDLIRLASLQTVARMLERDDFCKRYQGNQSIGIHEFLYPILQGYDSVVIQADVELGGTDQLFNLLMGRHMQKHYQQSPQVVLTMPLLIGLDGVKKMSKSYKNYIAIDAPAADMFGQLMSISDDLMWHYLTSLQLIPNAMVTPWQVEVEEGLNPRDIKIRMATLIVQILHGKDLAEQSRIIFEQQFQQRKQPSDLQTFTIPAMPLPQVLKQTHLTASTSEAIRLIRQGAVKVNQIRIDDPAISLEANQTYIIQAGKRRWAKVLTNPE